VRWPCIVALSLVGPAGVAADSQPTAPAARSGAAGDFWRDVVDPHAAEIANIVHSVRTAIKTADDALQSDAEWAVEQRMRYYRDAYGMLQYARRLAPEHPEVLALLGRAADEIGMTRVAIDALEAHVRIRGPEKTSADAVGRLGAIYLRLGERDAAVRYLRQAQGPLRPETAQPLVHLANALAARGEVQAAVDTLTSVVPARPPSYYPQELTLAAFALAVIYDRDEQRGAAFEVLDRMRTTLQHAFGPQVLNALARMRYAPAEDQHYYLALLYEALDQYPEARAAWALYAASGDTPWRDRALDHIRAIDAQRRAAVEPKPTAQPSPPPAIQRTVRP
jgi:tetratricopeptide (TPR) repeat protein